MKNAAVTDLNLVLVLATLAISGFIFIGCGGDTACEGDACGPGPTTDAGTNGDPITKEDGGVSDSGDVTPSDAGSDAGKDPDCSAEAYPKLNKKFNCCISSCGDRTCSTAVDEGKCAMSCPGSFQNIALDDDRLTFNEGGFTLNRGDGTFLTCTETN